ncbi:XdhC/CoxI family protein [Streptomyces sp. RFCAC02]|uniref:XdhC family protein n=1 Tax=Streptomyces sp. RFCAC02 TaxID=2499143 RepID=UPI0010226002|nr:XdhC/CoxI family protein [Streptomyces sp. RFCAC02]
MLELAGTLRRWTAEGRDWAAATVTAVRGSAPRLPGATLAVAADGAVAGSVSGGCVEAAVHDLCRTALERGRRVARAFGPAGDDPFAPALTCGGGIEVLVTPVRAADPERPVVAAALDAAAAGRPAALVRPVTGTGAGGALLVRPGEPVAGTLGAGRAADHVAAREAAALLRAGRTGTVRVPHGTLFVEASLPPPRLLVFGAVDFAAALVTAGTFLGHRVTVCDARPVFTTPERFPGAAEVVTEWPHRYLDREAPRLDPRTAVCVLTHDARFDVPLLTRALALPLAYVGAMGSRRTHAARVRALRDAGVTEGALARLRSPIGLDLGARTPQETALSIAAEIVALRHGGTGAPLTGTGDADAAAGRPIHARGHVPGPWTASVGSAHDLAPGDDPSCPQPRSA